MRKRLTKLFILLSLAVSFVLFYSCNNDPYPDEQVGKEKVFYTYFDDPPKDLDPQKAYSSIVDNVEDDEMSTEINVIQ